MKQFCFKVIGPTSSSATWVKEGDEFEEDETMEAFKMLTYDELSYDNGTEEQYYKKLGYYKIKGPCGHFH